MERLAERLNHYLRSTPAGLQISIEQDRRANRFIIRGSYRGYNVVRELDDSYHSDERKFNLIVEICEELRRGSEPEKASPYMYGIDLGADDEATVVAYVSRFDQEYMQKWAGEQKKKLPPKAKKMSLKEWATRRRPIGKYRWLEVEFTDSAGYGVVAVRLQDHSYPDGKKYRWYQSAIHSSMSTFSWRKTVAAELRKMRKESQTDLQNWMDSN